MLYQIGQLARIIVQWEDINGNPADPTTVTVLVQSPDGTQQTYGVPPIERDGVGLYHYDLTCSEAGSYLFVWTAGGAIDGAQQGSITVAESILTAPVAPPINLCTLDEVRYWLNLKTDNAGPSDLKLERLITGASRMILSLTDRDSFITPQTYSERRNGNGTNSMATYEWPIQSVSSVLYSPGHTIPASSDGFQNGWVNDAYRVMLIGYWFPIGFQNVTLNYTAGFTAVPEDITQACIELVAQKWVRSSHIDQEGGSLAQQTVTWSKRDIPAEVQTVIDHYKRRAVIE